MVSTVYATFEDVQAIYEGTLADPGDRPRIEALLTRASVRLTAIVPALPTMLVNNKIDTDIPTGLVVDAVLAVWRNPTGATTLTVGPFSQSFLRGEKQSSDIWFDEDRVRKLILGGFQAKPGTFKLKVPPRDPRLGPVVPSDGLDADVPCRYTPEQLRGL